MCVIAVSRKGIRQPTFTQIKTMWRNNPDGAGYMVAGNGYVWIKKGFMRLDDLLDALHDEKFNADASVVYHFRISTQGGVNPGMTHPFPLNKSLTETDIMCQMGFAHNGVIRMTANPTSEYSDTALFVRRYMPYLIRNKDSIFSYPVQEMIQELTHSKWAIMNEDGDIATIGYFTTDEQGREFSNNSFKSVTWGRVR